MGDTAEAKKSGDAAYNRVTDVLGVLRMSGELPWHMVLDLTRELDEPLVFDSPRDARKVIRAQYNDDRWTGQPYFPVLVAEKDTLEPILKPHAQQWSMPFASSRGYSSLKLQHDVAKMLNDRRAQTGQEAIIYFVSSSGLREGSK